MDDDLMARRLRPPSQPTPDSGQAGQPPSPWDVPLTEDGSFAPAQPTPPQSVPSFAPPDPDARADVPWDRPAPEAWPPAEDAGTDDPQTSSAQSGTPAADDPAEWPSPDAIGDATPWERPTNDQSLDPDDAMAPVVGDVNVPAGVWHEWSADGPADGDASNGNGNGNGNGSGDANGAGVRYASTPEPMTVAAHSDQPRSGDEPRPDAWVDAFDTSPSNPGAAMSGGSGPSLPEWPAEDDLTPPSSSRGPVMPEDSGPVTSQDAASPAPPAPSEPAQPAEPTPEPTPAPDQAQTPEAPPQPPQPVAPPPALRPIVTSAQIIPSPAGSPQNMVLRIELAIVIVDQSQGANPAGAATRVGPDADVRAPEYDPRTHVGRAPMSEPEPEPEPEYEWGTPAQPQQMDWDLPPVRGPGQDEPAPWSTPQQHQPQPSQPAAPPPTWAMTEPTPLPESEPPQYMPPPAAQQQPAPQPTEQPAWPPSESPDPLHDLPAAPRVPSVNLASAASSSARTGQAEAAADQADQWFLSNQPSVATIADDDVEPAGKSYSILTAGLTVGFALLVIVLVLVFIQLMTSLLK